MCGAKIVREGSQQGEQGCRRTLWTADSASCYVLRRRVGLNHRPGFSPRQQGGMDFFHVTTNSIRAHRGRQRVTSAQHRAGVPRGRHHPHPDPLHRAGGALAATLCRRAARPRAGVIIGASCDAEPDMRRQESRADMEQL